MSETIKPSVIKLSSVSLSYRGQTILDNICLDLSADSFLGLIGPNGAGKSMLLKIVVGLIKPTSGTVEVFGLSPEAARGRVGYVPQFASFASDFPTTVLDAVLMGRLGSARIGARFSAVDKEKALTALKRVELSSFAERNVRGLSGGEVQRVLIARALAAEPKLLLLDEPTASLDSRVGRDVYDLLDDLAKEMTIVLVSHDVGAIASHVKTIACLNRKLHYHNSLEISAEVINEIYGCPVDLIAHGHEHCAIPHRILSAHGGCSHGEGAGLTAKKEGGDK